MGGMQIGLFAHLIITHTHTGPYSSTEDLIVHEITVLFNNKQHNCVINIVIYLTVLES